MSKKIKFVTNKLKEKWKLSGFNSNCFGGYKIEIESNNEMLVDGCIGVYEYKNDYIRLNLTKGNLSVSGLNLTMDILSDSVMKIKGKINNIDFNA